MNNKKALSKQSYDDFLEIESISEELLKWNEEKYTL
jgi:hypothetical protein